MLHPMREESFSPEKLNEWRRVEYMQKFIKENQDREILEKAEKLNYDAVLFCPHDLVGEEVELDEFAFEVIKSWGLLSNGQRNEVLNIVRSVRPPSDPKPSFQ